MGTQFADSRAFELTLILLVAAVIAFVLVIGIMALTQDMAIFNVAGLGVDDPAIIPRLFSPWAVDANRFVF